MMHVIIRGLIDRPSSPSARRAIDELARTVADYPPERGGQITGSTRTPSATVARLWGEAGAGVIFWGMGISQHTTGTDNARCLIALCLDDRQRRPAGHRAPPAARPEQRAGRLGRRPDPRCSTPTTRRWTATRPGERFEQAWGVPLDPKPG